MPRGEGSPAWGSSRLSAWDRDAHLQSSHCNAAALLHSNRYRIGDLSHFIPFTVKAVLNSRVTKHAGRAVMLVAVRSSVRKSQIGLLFPSASIYYLRCMTKLFLRKLLYSTDFFLPSSIIWVSFVTIYCSAHSVLSQGIAPLTYKLLQYKKRLKVLQQYIVCTWERGRAA